MAVGNAEGPRALAQKKLWVEQYAAERERGEAAAERAENGVKQRSGQKRRGPEVEEGAEEKREANQQEQVKEESPGLSEGWEEGSHQLGHAQTRRGSKQARGAPAEDDVAFAKELHRQMNATPARRSRSHRSPES